MNRINVFKEVDGDAYSEFQSIYQGWFDLDSSVEVASCKKGSPYVVGKTLLSTASGKLVVNDWNNYSDVERYRFVKNEAEIVEILVESGYEGVNKLLIDILSKYEI